MMTKYPQVARRWLVGAVCVMGSQMTWAATAIVDFSELVEQNAKAVVNISASTKAKKGQMQALNAECEGAVHAAVAMIFECYGKYRLVGIKNVRFG